MDAATGDVVYTVVKETDFGSNMYNGAFTQSGFARVAKRALDPRNGGKAVIEDYTAYTPSAFLPQMFAAVPVIADGQTIGVFVAQIDIRALNNLLTDNNDWRSTGQGETGEVLLTGEDRLMRSQAYDIWGRTLSVARGVVQETEPGSISLSDSTYALLTDVDGFKPCPPIENPALGIITTWNRPLVERLAVEVITPPETQAASYAAK